LSTRPHKLGRGSASTDAGPVTTGWSDVSMTRQLLLSGLLLIGAVTSSTPYTTNAMWTTLTSSTSNQFSAGTLHISDNLAIGTTLSMDHLIAGDNFDAELDVDNSGSLSLVYALSTSVSDPAGLTTA